MDREIKAASEGGVDFFSLLWYYARHGSEHEAECRLLNRGLANYLASESKSSRRVQFMIEFCNSGPFNASEDQDWNRCVEVWTDAWKSPAALRVEGRIVFKIHDLSRFIAGNGGDVSRCRMQLTQLRSSVHSAGLGDMIIGGGLMSRSEVHQDHPAVKLFDFTATYMSIPDTVVGPTELPYKTLVAEARFAREFHSRDPIPWVPYLPVGWNPRPWTHPEAGADHRRFFTFPTKSEWVEELKALWSDFDRFPGLGLPLRDGSKQPAFTIYAWNEFGEGGILAPTRGIGAMKLEAIRSVFGPSHPVRNISRG